MRITQDAIEELGSEKLEKAVEKARSDDRETIRAEDIAN
jgi:histone H3/H4